VASELIPWAQDAAARTFGYDLDHEGILKNPKVHARYADVLREVSEPAPASSAPRP
jgi:hypothetical protein